MARNDPKLHMITENNGGIILGYKSRGKILLQYMWCLDLFFFSLYSLHALRSMTACVAVSLVSHFKGKGGRKARSF